MRFLAVTILMCLPSAGLAQQKENLTGAWIITWAGDPNNTNPLMLTQKGDQLEGTYTNDAKETCKVAGVIDRKKGAVTFTIKGAGNNFEILCFGTLGNGKVVEGRYDFNNTSGDFSMARMEKKKD